ncbi:MAG: ATP-binding protein [Pseudomonadota bacterium]
MTIRNFDQFQTAKVITEFFTPSTQIESIERLKGRDDELKRIERALPSKGRHVFVYGDRGVGKTSIAMTAGHLHNDSHHSPLYVVCGENMSFFDVVTAIAHSVIPLEERIERQKHTGSLGMTLPSGLGGNFSGSTESYTESPRPKNINDCLDIIRYVDSKRDGQTIIIIDEIDRIKDQKEKVYLAEFLKSVPAIGCDAKLIFCGIGANVEEMIGAHQSVGRYFEAISVNKLGLDPLYDIIRDAADAFDVNIPDLMLRRVGMVSDQFPHFVHLLGESLFWAMFEDANDVSEARQEHYDLAIKGALQRAEADLQLSYQKATEKTRNTLDYEEVLWALADKSDSRRQSTEFYESSYLKIMERRPDRPVLTKSSFDQRLHNLKSDRHGEVIRNHLGGWFSFRENVFRGYVRLMAESKGVSLRQDIAVV